MKKLANKVAVVTGGNSGIGLSTAILFAEQGANVAITGRNPISLDRAVEAIGHGAVGIVSDVSDVNNITKAYEKVSEVFGKIDVLVVNAGVNHAGPLADYTEEQFDQISDINFKGAFFSVQRALPYLNDGASIILTSSAVNEKGFSNGAAYSATKAAVRSLARSFSTELMDRNIRVNVLSPGAIDTPFFGRGGASQEEVDGTKEYMASIIPAKRLGTVEEVAEGFLYLASDASKYMVGSELVMDGGVKTL
ncbi:SDR family oxidoreductase [Larkinella humicola]|uniref:SDR family oxidoreductase n=1 Tax=Larkinella humicola TaxID=2607654 RepID=A0A5N1JG03_9BACT|nr:SDR family oxidoreductase [Larkinella humicola]KAA9354025.1 SDR family oxidoreductase [Larkinella humicola]